MNIAKSLLTKTQPWSIKLMSVRYYMRTQPCSSYLLCNSPPVFLSCLKRTNIYRFSYKAHVPWATNSKRKLHISTCQLQRSEKEQQKENENGPENQSLPFIFFASFSLLGLSMLYLHKQMSEQIGLEMEWARFAHDVLPTGEVKAIYTFVDSSHMVLAELHPGSTFNVNTIKVSMKDNANVIELLRQKERELNIHPSSSIPVVRSLSPNSLLVIGIAFTSSLLLFMLAMRGRVPSKPIPKENNKTKLSDSFDAFKMFDTDVSKAVNTKVKFKDVAGMQEAKQEVMEFVQFLKTPEHYEKLGAKMPRGCLLTGPPGVGKTMLAKAVASEAGVPFIAKSGSDFMEMIGGLGARRIRQLFEKARDQAPCIVYIDELDAVGGARSGTDKFSSGSSERDQTLNQILVEMDGMLSKQHRVIVLASTNRPDILDKALLRPGRFDRLIDINLPTKIERQEILEQHLKTIKLDGVSSDYSAQLASETPGMSGADLANICNEAALYAARENDSMVNKKHVNYALERVTSGAPKSTTSLSPEERKKIAVHESGHALVGWLLEHTNALAKISIIPRSKGMLGITRTVPSDRYLHTQEQLFDNLCMALGGRAAEDVVFGHVTQGAEDDLKRVTKMAYAQVREFGFNSTVGPLSFQEEREYQVRPYSEALATIIDMEAKKLVRKAYDETKTLLKTNHSMLEKLSDKLLSQETLTYDEVVELIGPPAFDNKAQINAVPFGPETNQTDESSPTQE